METFERKNLLFMTPVLLFLQPSCYSKPILLKINSDEVKALFYVLLKYFSDTKNFISKQTIRWGHKNFKMRTYVYDDTDSGKKFKTVGITECILKKWLLWYSEHDFLIMI